MHKGQHLVLYLHFTTWKTLSLKNSCGNCHYLRHGWSWMGDLLTDADASPPKVPGLLWLTYHPDSD